MSLNQKKKGNNCENYAAFRKWDTLNPSARPLENSENKQKVHPFDPVPLV